MFTNKIPTKVGLYKYYCMETEYEESYAAITEYNKIFYVHEEGLGKTPLQNFHDGLTNLKWYFIS